LIYCRSRVFTFVFFMQTITGISSGKNNKSCRIIHNGSNKIGFEVFRFFYDFLHNLQESGKSLHYWSYPFAGRPSERKVSLQCSPWGRWPARAGEIPAMCHRSPAGEGKEGSYGSLALGFVGWTGTRRLRRWSAPAASGAGRRGWQCRRP
jgi:hypothetical protein